MSTHFLVRGLLGVAAALALLGAGCGGGDDQVPSADSQTATPELVGDSSQTYRDQVTAIVRVTDDARSDFRGAPPGEPQVTSARQLARASRAAAREVDELTPPGGLNDLNRDLAGRYRRWAAGLERELHRKPVSTGRLGDVVREQGKATDHVYEQILIAP
jgi:hypothetical protein